MARFMSLGIAVFTLLQGVAAAQDAQVFSQGKSDDLPFDPILIVTDLVVVQTSDGVRLQFTSPIAKTTDYAVKTSASAITPGNWVSGPGTILGTYPHHGAERTVQTIDIPMTLPPGTSHFAVQCIDDGSVQGYSNDASTTVATDTTAPAAPSNLRVIDADEDVITVAWNAPADDAVELQLSYATAPTATMWTPLLASPGSTWGPAVPVIRNATADSGLVAGVTYYFTAKSRDEAGNISTISLPTPFGAAFVPGVPGTGAGRGGVGCSASGTASLSLLAVCAAIGLIRRS